MTFAKKSKKQLLLGLFSNASLYGVAVILPRLGDVAMIPVYWSYMEPADFGIVALAQMLILFLGPILSLGLYDALQRLYFEWKAEERAQNVTAIWGCSLFVSTVICLFFDLVGRNLAHHVLTQIPFDPYVRVTIWTAFFINFTLVPYALLRVRDQVREFIVISIVTFALQTGLTVYFVVVAQKGALGYLLGGLVGNGLMTIYLASFMLREARYPRRLAGLFASLRYAVPLIPAMIIESVGNVFDRFFLDKYAGLQSIGFYNLGRQFGAAFNVFNIAMKFSWFPLIYRASAERADAPEILAKLSLYYIALLSLPALSIALLARELILWFGGDRYAAVYEFVPIFVLLYFMNSIGMAMGRGIDLAKKTIYNSLLAPIVLIVNFFAMWLLIPKYGVWGAAVGGLITMFVRHGVAIGVGFILYPRPLMGRQLATLTIICFTAFFLGSTIDTGRLAYDFVGKCFVLLVSALAIGFLCLDGRRAVIATKNWIRQRAQ